VKKRAVLAAKMRKKPMVKKGSGSMNGTEPKRFRFRALRMKDEDGVVVDEGGADIATDCSCGKEDGSDDHEEATH
jgi:hypothetical protein